jgi:RNA polymerase sigma factor (sigma-70 family)
MMDTTRPSLLIRVRDPRDQAAWSEFDAIYRPMLHRFAQARGLGLTDAEEIAQQCMTAINQHIKDFDYDPRKGKFKSWLRTMVGNKVKNLLRDRHEAQAKSRDFDRPQWQEPAPDEVFNRLWEEEHLKHCLRSVRSEVEDATFNVFFSLVMEERPIDQVCRDFNVNAANVRVIKSRMLQRIRRRMILLLGEEE